MRFFPFLETAYTVNIPGADMMRSCCISLFPYYWPLHECHFDNLPLLKSKSTNLLTIPATLKSIIHYILIRYGLERNRHNTSFYLYVDKDSQIGPSMEGHK
jgi:hypothetical protein